MRKTERLAALFLLLLPCLLSGRMAFAATEWDSLSADQQRLLGQFESRWEQIPEERRQRLARGAERWLAMTPEQRQKSRQRLRRWQQLSPEQRQRSRRARRFSGGRLLNHSRFWRSRCCCAGLSWRKR